MKTIPKLWIGLIILAVLSPVGIFLPEYFKGGDAWGEWGIDSVKELIGYIPAGLKELSSLWRAPIADYAFGTEEKSFVNSSIGYIISALAGVLACIVSAMLIGKMLTKQGK